MTIILSLSLAADTLWASGPQGLYRLEKQGLIAREASPSDKRSLLVKLTAKGRAVIGKAFAEDMAVEKDMLAPLDAGERKMLAALLAKLLFTMEEAGGDGAAQ